MHTLGERIQEYGVRISSFYLFQLNDSTTQRLNPSTPQHLSNKYFHHLLVSGFWPDLNVSSLITELTIILFFHFPVR